MKKMLAIGLVVGLLIGLAVGYAAVPRGVTQPRWSRGSAI